MKEHRLFSSRNLAIWTGGRWVALAGEIFCSGWAIDSRKVRPGDCFVAIRTAQNDGHRYLESARDSGAACALVSSPRDDVNLPQLVVPDTIFSLGEVAKNYRKMFDYDLVAIAGSYGKTTTKTLLLHLLGESAAGTNGNENNLLGVPLTLLRLPQSGLKYGVLEAGISYPGEMDRLVQILQPQGVIFTGFSKKHVSNFSSPEDLIAEKLKILSDSVTRCVHPSSLKSLLERQLTKFRRICVVPRIGKKFFSTAKETIFFRTHWDRLCRLMRCTLEFSDSVRPAETYNLPVPSEGFAQDFVLCRSFLDVPQEVIQWRLDRWQQPHLRGQTIVVGDRTFFLDCYNSDLPALIQSVRLFRRLFPRQKRHYVLAAMSEIGSQSTDYHRRAGMGIPFSRHDSFYLLGQETRPLGKALIQRGISSSQVQIFEEKEGLAAVIDRLKGPVMLKGSRLYALETLLPPGSISPTQ